MERVSTMTQRDWRSREVYSRVYPFLTRQYALSDDLLQYHTIQEFLEEVECATKRDKLWWQQFPERPNEVSPKVICQRCTILRVLLQQLHYLRIDNLSPYLKRLLWPGGLIMSDSRRRFRSAPLFPILAGLLGP